MMPHATRAHNPDPGRSQPAAPWPIERYELTHPRVPPALDGLTVLHLSDLHAGRIRNAGGWSGRAPGGREGGVRRLVQALASTPADLVVFTGDAMDRPGDEPIARAALAELFASARARLGVFGVLGNHDSQAMARLARTIPGVVWLDHAWADPHPNLRVLGLSFPEDPLRAATDMPPTDGDRFLLTLAHYPTAIYPCAALGWPVVLAGHTHGGQVRPFAGFTPHTSSDLPSNSATGILRLGSTLCAVSRGVGEAAVSARLNCPRQAPLYTLRRGALPGRDPSESPGRVRTVVAW